MKKILLIVLITIPNLLYSQIKSPEEFLGYPLGTRFTYHHKLIEYCKYLAQSKPEYAQWTSYGTTNEKRELGEFILANHGNISKLESIRLKHQAQLQGESNSLDKWKDLPLIINLSFNVHGNESAGSEAAIGLLYDLMTNDTLFQTKSSYVILIDPCINPDGRDAYVNQFNMRNFNLGGNPDPFDQEHFEGSISGRYNHYLFDLNRDWIWQTQLETKQRMKFFTSWLPMVHADFHEQSFQHSYYFPPAAKPYLNFISNSTKELQESVGKSFAKLFDSNNWNYFTREVYDLYYPGYGDTYPILNGALAMTLEQGGIRGGLRAQKLDGDTITFVERVKHHRALAGDLIRWSIANESSVKESFYKNHDNARNNPANQFKTYLIPEDQIEKSTALINLLKSNRVEMNLAGKDLIVKNAYSFRNETNSTLKISSKDLIISAYQSSSPIIKVMLDPVIALEDSLTYDITAWNLFDLHQINAYGLSEKIVSIVNFEPNRALSNLKSDAVAYTLAPNQNEHQFEFLDKVLKSGFKVVYNDTDVSLDSKVYKSGQFFILKLKKELDFQQIVKLSNQLNLYLEPVFSFKSDNSVDLGSKHLINYQSPKIAVIVNPNFDTNQQGELAHYFTQKNHLNVTFLPLNHFFEANLFQYSHIIFPSGSHKSFTNDQFVLLNDWIYKGGNCVVLENAIQLFDSKSNSSHYSMALDLDTTVIHDKYQEKDRNEIGRGYTGNLVKVNVENSNPLMYGIDQSQIYLINNTYELYKPSKDWHPLLETTDNVRVKGFLGNKSKKKLNKTQWMSFQESGQGKVIWFGFNPLFRAIETEASKAFSNCFIYYNF